MSDATPTPPKHGLASRASWQHWALLIGVSLLATLAFAEGRISAALLLGPMITAIVLAQGGLDLRIPPRAFQFAQGVVGTMIAHGMPAATLTQILGQGPLFIGCVLSVIGIAVALGVLLQYWRVLPGTTALWGTFPGAASAMALMSAAFGGDMRLVALMQYLRVLMVALAATLVAHLWQLPDSHAASPLAQDWLNFGPLTGLLPTLALIAAGVLLGTRSRLPAGALLLPMIGGILLQDAGLLQITLPPALLATAYALLGWSIGLRFTRQVLREAWRALPQVLGAIVALLLLCGAIAWGLVVFADVDPLTAYLATSPGGADSVAIIAASSAQVDVPFVMAMQSARLLVVVAIGPVLARWLGQRLAARD